MCVLLVGLLTDVMPAVPITQDPLLVAVFGGIFNGAGISLCLLANASSGGTDIIALFMGEIKGRDCWNAVFLLNVVVLSIAACCSAGTRRSTPLFSSSSPPRSSTPCTSATSGTPCGSSPSTRRRSTR